MKIILVKIYSVYTYYYDINILSNSIIENSSHENTFHVEFYSVLALPVPRIDGKHYNIFESKVEFLKTTINSRCYNSANFFIPFRLSIGENFFVIRFIYFLF